MTWKPDICLYHSHCDDGFASAWVVHRKWGDAVQYVPMHYGGALPDMAGKHVLMVDYSLKREAMLEAQNTAKSIIVLDHHKTAEAELISWMAPMEELVEWAALEGDHRGAIAVFDMDKSGCRLTWEFCFPGKPMPRLLEHIEDRDLWRFKLPYTKEVTAAIRSWDHSFAHFDSWAATDCGTLIWAGGAILRANDKAVADFLEQSYMADVFGHTVPVCNVPYRYASDCGHALLKKYPEAPFAATWWRLREGKVGWSLRSEDSREDVAKIAAAMGGGGHRNAAGFTVPAAPPLLHVDPQGNVVEVAP